MANPQVVVDFIANTKDLSNGFKTAGSESGGLGTKLKGLARAGVVAGGAAGLAALTGTLKIGIDELTESAKVTAQTKAVIKSTGGAAGVTAKQVAGLADAMMRKTGIDDETIQSGENLLLTFRDVQNRAGKGNDIFTRATKVMLDMSVALGQDTKTSAMQLGKALNDPIRGVSQLRRVGVTFTDAQKNQITALVESGHKMEAQKMILQELNKEFGGSAVAAGKTLPGQLNILKESFSNLAGGIVKVFVPAFSAVTDFFVKNPDMAKAVVLGILAISGAFVALNIVLGIATGLMTAFDIAAAPAIAIVAGIVAGIAAIIAIAILLVKNWDTITGAISDAFNAVKDIVGKMVSAVKSGFDAFKKGAETVYNWLKTNWPYLVGILGGPIGIAVAAIIKNWDKVKSATTDAFNAVKETVTDVANAVKGAISGLATFIWNLVHGTLGNAIDAVKDAFNTVKEIAWDVYNGIKNAFNAVADFVWKIFHESLGNAISAVKDAFTAIKEGAWAAFDGIKNAINAVIDWVNGVVKGTLGKATGAAKDVFAAIKEGAWAAFNGVKNAFNAMITWIGGIVGRVTSVIGDVVNAIKAPINAVIRAWNSLSIPRIAIDLPSIKVLGHKIGGGSFGFGPFDFPDIPLLARGGVFDSPTLAVVGEAGREIVAPENLLRDIVGSRPMEVHVYIGDQELTSLVRTQVVDVNTGIARTLLAGAAT